MPKPAQPRPRIRSLSKPPLPRNAWVLLAINLTNSVAFFSVGSLINPYLRNLGMSAAFVGLYFAVLSIVQGLASFAGGFLADTIGRRRVWIAGKVMQIMAYAILASGLRGSTILIAAVLTGAGQIGIGAMNALQADAAEDRWRATYLAVLMTVNGLTGVIAPLAGGLLADRFGANWALIAILPLLMVVVRLISILEEKARLTASPAAPNEKAAAASLRARLQTSRRRLAELAGGIIHGPYPRAAIGLLVWSLLSGVTNGVLFLSLPLMLRDRFGMGYTGVAAMQTALSLGAVATTILGARVADRIGRRRVILAATSLAAGLIFFVPQLTSATQLYGAIFLISLVINSATGALAAAQMESVSQHARATYGGVVNGLVALGAAIGNLSGGLVYRVEPMLTMYIAAAGFALGAIFLTIFLQETSATVKAQRAGDVSRAADGDSG